MSVHQAVSSHTEVLLRLAKLPSLLQHNSKRFLSTSSTIRITERRSECTSYSSDSLCIPQASRNKVNLAM